MPEPLGQVLRLATKSFQTPAEGAQHVMQAISAAQQAKCAAVEFAEVTDQFPFVLALFKATKALKGLNG